MYFSQPNICIIVFNYNISTWNIWQNTNKNILSDVDNEHIYKILLSCYE